MPVDYSKGKIYKIYSPSSGDTYIGSTVETLSQRMSKHKHNHRAHQNGIGGLVTVFSVFENNDDCIIELVEDYPCERREQLLQREGYWIRELNCVNKNIMGRTRKEWCEVNKDTLRERGKKYREVNKDAIREKKKEYREAHKEEIRERDKKYNEAHKEELREKKKEYREAHKEEIREKKKEYREAHKEEIRDKKKEYNEAHKDVIREKKKQHYQAHKDVIREKMKQHYQAHKEEITCECGSKVDKTSLSRHKRTKKHLAWEQKV